MTAFENTERILSRGRRQNSSFSADSLHADFFGG
jgi:hypothetical protein